MSENITMVFIRKRSHDTGRLHKTNIYLHDSNARISVVVVFAPVAKLVFFHAGYSCLETWLINSKDMISGSTL